LPVAALFVGTVAKTCSSYTSLYSITWNGGAADGESKGLQVEYDCNYSMFRYGQERWGFRTADG
jgi:hypothetical protein